MSKKHKRPHHHHERTEARRLALQMLYQSEIVGKTPSAILADASYIAEEGVPSAYAERLLRGVEEHREEIDDDLRTASEHWTLSRMPAVDRSLLRLAAYEMLYVDEVPLSVSINEAVELAKRFGGGDDSHRFVNGILGRIARGIEAEGEKSAEELAAAGGSAPSAVDMVAAAFAREQEEESAGVNPGDEPASAEQREETVEGGASAPASEPVDSAESVDAPADEPSAAGQDA